MSWKFGKLLKEIQEFALQYLYNMGVFCDKITKVYFFIIKVL